MKTMFDQERNNHLSRVVIIVGLLAALLIALMAASIMSEQGSLPYVDIDTDRTYPQPDPPEWCETLNIEKVLNHLEMLEKAWELEINPSANGVNHQLLNGAATRIYNAEKAAIPGKWTQEKVDFIRERIKRECQR